MHTCLFYFIYKFGKTNFCMHFSNWLTILYPKILLMFLHFLINNPFLSKCLSLYTSLFLLFCFSFPRYSFFSSLFNLSTAFNLLYCFGVCSIIFLAYLLFCLSLFIHESFAALLLLSGCFLSWGSGVRLYFKICLIFINWLMFLTYVMCVRWFSPNLKLLKVAWL